MTGRTSSGQFAEGNTFGKGRPKRETERDYLIALREICTIDDWKEIMKRAVEDAKKGDARARQFLANYMIGTRQEGVFMAIAVEEEMGIDPVEDEVKAEKWNRDISVGLAPSHIKAGARYRIQK